MSNNPKNKAPEPLTNAGEQIPPGLEFLAVKNPLEGFQAMFPGVQSDFKSLAPLMSLHGFDPGFHVPEWAKKSAQIGMEMMGFEINQTTENLTSPAFGKMVGFIEAAPPMKDERLKSARAARVKDYVCKIAKEEASNAAPEKSKQFFNARAKGAIDVSQISFMPQRAKAFLFISIAWQVIPELKSAAELHRLLIHVKALSANTDPAETRKLCRIIGLQLKGKAGRTAGK